MNRDIDTPILIVGAGSVGLSLAAELGYRGQKCLLIERSATLNPHPRANAVANRTMEYYRRYGIDEAISEAGIPSDVPARYFWVSTLFGHKIHQIELPPYVKIRQGSCGGYAKGEQSWSPYLKTTTGQNEVEQIIFDYVQSCDSVDMRLSTELLSFEDQGNGLLCCIRNADGAEQIVRCRYLAACDGGRSEIRESFGEQMDGRAGLARFISIYFRAPELIDACKFGHANIYFPLHRDCRGFILNWDGHSTFTYHLILKDGEAWEDVDIVAAIRSVVGKPIDIDILSTQPWNAHALTAKSYRPSENIFLVGDAAHLFTPTGGFGMNTGVSDAMDIAWKLEAMLKGWGGGRLLDSYHTERRPIGVRNTTEAANCFDELYGTMQCGGELDAGTEAGEALRRELGESLKRQEKLIASSGTLLGYRYEGSPIIVPDGTPEPADDARNYVPTARPGHRAPHVWLADGTALMDRFGKGFTLLISDGDAAEAAPFLDAAAEMGVPVKTVTPDNPHVLEAYQRRFALIRPDLMVAWRGNQLPAEPETVLARVTGH